MIIFFEDAIPKLMLDNSVMVYLSVHDIFKLKQKKDNLAKRLEQYQFEESELVELFDEFGHYFNFAAVTEKNFILRFPPNNYLNSYKD